MGTSGIMLALFTLYCLVKIPPTTQDHHLSKKTQSKHGGQSDESRERIVLGDQRVREGLKCYKCDPTDYNNYCRDFKPNLATPYDCDLPEHSKSGTKNSPLNTSISMEIPFSCFKIKADVAYGHGKVYGAKRYGCGHVTKVRSLTVIALETECKEIKSNVPNGTPGLNSKLNKDAFFDGIVCNCDNADGCNSTARKSISSMSVMLFLILLRMILECSQ